MNIDLIQVPYDGAHRSRRMGRGPKQLVDAGIVEHLRARGHEVRLLEIDSSASFGTDAGTAFELARLVSRHVDEARKSGRFPLVLAGNCGSSIGTVAGLGAGRVGVAWFDAHGDFNTPETTPSGFLDGMALAVLTGRCWRALAETVPGFEPIPESRVILAGVRDLDPEEASALERSAVRLVPADEAGRSGIPQAIEREVEGLSRTVRGLYLHIDFDVLDPEVAHVNEFAAPGGLALGELIESLGRIRARIQIEALALTAYDPAFDADGRVVRVAFDIVETVLG